MTQSKCFPLSFGNFLSSFFILDNTKFLSFQFRNQNPKLQGGVKTHLLACLWLRHLNWALTLSPSRKWLSSRSHGSPREFGKNEMELGWREQVPKNQNPNLQMHHRLGNPCPRQLYQQEMTPNISLRPLKQQSLEEPEETVQKMKCERRLKYQVQTNWSTDTQLGRNVYWKRENVCSPLVFW